MFQHIPNQDTPGCGAALLFVETSAQGRRAVAITKLPILFEESIAVFLGNPWQSCSRGWEYFRPTCTAIEFATFLVIRLSCFSARARSSWAGAGFKCALS